MSDTPFPGIGGARRGMFSQRRGSEEKHEGATHHSAERRGSTRFWWVARLCTRRNVTVKSRYWSTDRPASPPPVGRNIRERDDELDGVDGHRARAVLHEDEFLKPQRVLFFVRSSCEKMRNCRVAPKGGKRAPVSLVLAATSIRARPIRDPAPPPRANEYREPREGVSLPVPRGIYEPEVLGASNRSAPGQAVGERAMTAATPLRDNPGAPAQRRAQRGNGIGYRAASDGWSLYVGGVSDENRQGGEETHLRDAELGHDETTSNLERRGTQSSA
ncbi:hypothetical protein DFH07DRAFT_769279 [Mycena maculata]|uniref:Uncharacterized protein n=1 Tax=Mycena maculata TaxID=230809 RepID=A0AAD7JNM1_9AGAR|nr:hypothetical protein DFH07DRAFT_769279 [Mycena maculata]